MKDNCKLEKLFFNYIKMDILSVMRPISKTFQDNSLLLPEMITVASSTIKTLKKLDKLIRDQETLLKPEFFPSVNKFIDELKAEEGIISYRQTRQDHGETGNIGYSYHGYLLTGNIDKSLEKNAEHFTKIFEKLIEAMTLRLGSIPENPLFISVASFLDTRLYICICNSEDLSDHINTMVDRYRLLLEANNCNLENIHYEFDIIFDHVKHFMPNRSSSKAWPLIFKLKEGLGIKNILQVAELCIAIPISNAESERVFSFLWNVFSKNRQSLKNSSLEDILRLRCGTDFSDKRYNHLPYKQLSVT